MLCVLCVLCCDLLCVDVCAVCAVYAVYTVFVVCVRERESIKESDVFGLQSILFAASFERSLD